MPKVVDHESRRQLVADALLELVAIEGFGAITVRRVADRAGCSPGAVQHYFDSKRDLLLFALSVVVSRVSERLEAIANVSPVMEQIRQSIVDTLPFDDLRRTEALVWLAFVTQAAVDPEFAAVVESVDNEVRNSLSELIILARSRDEIESLLDPRIASDLLIATSDGIASRMLSGGGGLNKRQALDLVDAIMTVTLQPVVRRRNTSHKRSGHR